VTNKTVTWSSSAASVATVSSSGEVKAVAEGTATITVTTKDGNKTATCTVIVTASTTSGQAITVSILGTPKVYEKLTADVQKNFAGEITYEWYRGTASTPIEYETSSTYWIKLDDANKTIKVKVTCLDKTAEASVSVPDVTYEVRIHEDEEDTIYSYAYIVDGNYSIEFPNDCSFQWYRNSSAISGAKSDYYVLQNADKGNTISIKVTRNGKPVESSNTIDVPAVAILEGNWGYDESYYDYYNNQWIYSNSIYNFTNGIFVYSKNDVSHIRGTYTTTGNSITLTLTSLYNPDEFNGLAPGWYSKEELLDEFPSDSQEIEEWFAPQKATYSVSITAI
jgi:hypothetical protein